MNLHLKFLVCLVALFSWGVGPTTGNACQEMDRDEQKSVGPDEDLKRQLDKFQQLAEQELDSSQIGQDKSAQRQFVDKLNSMQGRNDLLMHVGPGNFETCPIKSLEVYGLANEWLKETDWAISIYQKVLDRDDTRDMVRLRLMRLQMESDPKSSEIHLGEFHTFNREMAEWLLLDSFPVRSRQVVDSKQMFANTQFVIENFQALVDVSDSTDWIVVMLKRLGAGFTEDQKGARILPALAIQARTDADKESQPPETPATPESIREAETNILARQITARRDELHDQLANKMLASSDPRLAAGGFSALLGVAEARGETVGQKFRLLADGVVEKQIKQAPEARHAAAEIEKDAGIANWEGERYLRHTLPQVQEVDLKSPLEFLALTVGTDQRNQGAENQSDILEQWVARLKSTRLSAEADQFKTRYLLYCSPADKFVDAARATIREAVAKRKGEDADTARQEALQTIVRVWRNRKTDADISSLILEVAGASSPGEEPNQAAAHRFLIDYFSTLDSSGQRDRIRPLMQMYCESLLGDVFQQQSVAALAKDSATFQKHKKYPAWQTYRDLVDRVIQDHELIAMGAREASRLEMNEQLETSVEVMQDAFDLSQEPARLEAWLEKSGFLDDIETFDPIDMRIAAGATVWGSAIERKVRGGVSAAYVSSFEKGEHKRFSEAGEDSAFTFGEGMLMMLGNGDIFRAVNMWTRFGSMVKKLESLPVAQQRLLCRFWAEFVFKGRGGIPTRKKVATEGRSYVRRTLGNPIDSAVKKLLAAESIEDLGLPKEHLWRRLAKLIDAIEQRDTELQMQAFVKSLELIDQNFPHDDLVPGEDEHPRSSLLTRMLGTRSGVGGINYFLVTMNSKHGNQFGDIFWVREALVDRLGGLCYRASKKWMRTGGNPRQMGHDLAIIAGLLNRMGQAFGDRDASVLIPSMLQAFIWEEIDNTPEAEGILRFLSEEAESGQFKRQARTLKTVVQASAVLCAHNKHLGRYQFFEGTSEDALPVYQVPDRLKQPTEYQTVMMKVVNDSRRPIFARRLIAEELIRHDPTLPAGAIFDCVEVLASSAQHGNSLLEVARYAPGAMLSCKVDPRFPAAATSFIAAVSPELKKRPGRSSLKDARLALPKIIDLIGSLDQQEAIHEILDDVGGLWGWQEEGLLALVRNGFIEEANATCLRLWNSPKSAVRLFGHREAFPLEFSVSLEKHLPAFVESFVSDEQQFLAEVYFSAFPDPTEGRPLPEIDRETRLARLAERYQEVYFSSVSYHLIALASLCQSNAPNPVVLAHFKTLAGDDPFNDSLLSFPSVLAAHFVVAQFRNDNFEPLIAVYEAWSGPERGDSDDMQAELEYWLGSTTVVKKYAGVSPDVANLLQLAIAKVANPKTSSKLKTEHFRQSDIALRLLAGKSDELLEDYAVNITKRENGSGGYRGWAVNKICIDLGQYFQTRNETPDQKTRFELIEAVFKFAKTTGVLFGNGKYGYDITDFTTDALDETYRGYKIFGFDAIKQAQLMTADEVATFGGKFAQIESCFGLLWYQIARERMEKGQLKQAAVAMRRALASSHQKGRGVKFRFRFSVELAEIEFALRNLDQAKKLLPEKLPGYLSSSRLINRARKLKSQLGVD